ncbi:MAG: D-tyrosyl-tRNA(Tyr) deacylase [Erysipelotrichaceae bacterium]|nr:D-tyrosyl-tRNA(Tyr) deacylase [Erysipelotrichaceae bacterium]
MKVVLQRVKHASVTIDGNVYGKINQGYLLLVGITDGDTETEAKKLADKIVDLRIFEDENGKMNLGIEQVNGAILSISQFTLYADCKKGRRPSFTKAARPEISNPLYETFNEFLKDRGMHVETGVFGADMKVELLNDGPVTIILDSNEL